MEPIMTPVQAELIRAACTMAAKKEFSHLLYLGDLLLPEDLLRAKSPARKKLVQVVASEAQRQVIEAMGIPTLALTVYEMTRAEKFKIALVHGIAQGIFKAGEVVLGLLGRRPATYPDSILVVTIGADEEHSIDTGFGVTGSAQIPSAVLESVIDLAIGVAVDGWEGRPMGTLLVVGDSAAVMEKSKQLTLNPFQGYSEAEKNVLNPDVRNAIRNFAVLDGAFVIREDGVVLAAGRYLRFDEGKDFKVPLGLGARHVAAAGISQDTNAVAIVVSETTGEVRVFQRGRCVLQLNPQKRVQHAVEVARAPRNPGSAASESQLREAAEAVEGRDLRSRETRELRAVVKEREQSKDKDPPKEPREKSKAGREG